MTSHRRAAALVRQRYLSRRRKRTYVRSYGAARTETQPSADRSSRAAASGSAASRIARTTTTRFAPAAATSPTFVASIPPIANHGDVSPATRAACSISSSPAAGRPGLRRRLPDRPGADLIGPRVAARHGRGVELRRRVGREADDGARARLPPGVGDRLVVLADVDAVGIAALDQPGLVVEEEQRPVLTGDPCERLRERDQLLGTARRLLAQLDHVGAAAHARPRAARRAARRSAAHRRRSRDEPCAAPRAGRRGAPPRSSGGAPSRQRGRPRAGPSSHRALRPRSRSPGRGRGRPSR